MDVLYNVIILDKNSTIKTLVDKLQVELEIDLNSFKTKFEGTELAETQKLSTLLPYQNKDIFFVICKVDVPEKLTELQSDVEVQAFVYEEENKPKTFWTLNLQFYAAQEVAKFPHNCVLWSRIQVDYWFLWAVRHFKLSQKDSMKIWDFDGKELCSTDPNVFESETFRAHIKILCQFNLVCSPIQCLESDVKQYTKAVSASSAMKTVCSQPVSLWEFLLKLLIDKTYKDVIVWCDDKGKFKVLNIDKVAELWGLLNQNVHCSYDSIHHVIVKGLYKEYFIHVKGEKYVYQYIIDINDILGIPPLQINQLRQNM